MISNQQTPQEWIWFLDQVSPVNSVLEIDSYNGNSIAAWASSGSVNDGGVIRSIDLGNHNTGRKLEGVCEALRGCGLDAQCLIANSRDKSTEDWARQWAPYDVVFIDGDHTYEGAKADWEQYGPMGKIVAFHDIGGNEAGCVRLWQEVKVGRKTLEYTAHERYQIVSMGPQGIGVVFQDDRAA